MISRYTRPAMGAIWSDTNKFRVMLDIEILSAEAWARRGAVPRAALAVIKKKARLNIPRIEKIERIVKHDIIAFLTQVSETIGPAARYLHLGMTSSDVLDTTLGVQLRQSGALLVAGLDALIRSVRVQARRHRHTVMMGRSHGVHAEPITFGLKMANHYAELKRCSRRLTQARDAVRVGKISGAVGTYSHLAPAIETYICGKLGLRPAAVSSQVVSRDVYAEYLSQLAVIGACLERLAVEIRHLQRTEVLEAEEPFTKGQKGSSAMPHKRNPVGCENITGLARLLRSYAHAAIENIALWHERDISHSSVERVVLPDANILLDYMLFRMNEIISGLVVYPRNMQRNMERTRALVTSQRLMLTLVEKGFDRQKAYELVQAHAMKAWTTGADFNALVRDNPVIRRHISAREFRALTDISYYTRWVDAIFKRNGL